MTTNAPNEPRKGRLLRGALLVVLVMSALLSALLFTVVQDLEVRGASMAPLLHGDEGDRDRLLTLRPYYWFAAVKRYDLVVFERPETAPEAATPPDLSGDLFVKRAFALSGEDVLVQAGDVFIRGSGSAEAFEVLRKPYRILRDLITTCDHYRAGKAESLWNLPPEVVIEDGQLILAAEPETVPPTLYFRDNIVLDDPVTGRQAARDVGVRLSLNRVEGSQPDDFLLRIELREEGDVFALELSADHARVVVRPDTASEPTLERDLDLDPAVAVQGEILFMNVDDRLLLVIDGVPVLELEYPGNTEVPFGPWRNAPVITLLKGRVGISEIWVERDAHYTEMGELGVVKPYSVPSGGLYVLGDNSPKSRDSRHFGSVPEESLRGRPIAIRTPAARRRRL